MESQSETRTYLAEGLDMKIICYCFGYTDSDIIEDVIKNGGYSLIEERIAETKKNGACQCELKNPKKR